MEENSTMEKPAIFSLGLKYGVFMAVASIVLTVIYILLGINPFIQSWRGWIAPLISVALIVLCHREFKQNGDGYMTYGQGFGLAFLAMLTSLLIGMVFTYVYLTFIDPSLLEEMLTHTAEEMEKKGQNQQAIDMATTWTKKLFWPFYFIGGVVMSAVIALVISIFTQKKNPVPTYI